MGKFMRMEAFHDLITHTHTHTHNLSASKTAETNIYLLAGLALSSTLVVKLPDRRACTKKKKHWVQCPMCCFSIGDATRAFVQIKSNLLHYY